MPLGAIACNDAVGVGWVRWAGEGAKHNAARVTKVNERTFSLLKLQPGWEKKGKMRPIVKLVLQDYQTFHGKRRKISTCKG
jgi:hypothetical protein